MNKSCIVLQPYRFLVHLPNTVCALDRRTSGEPAESRDKALNLKCVSDPHSKDALLD
jgi:hypothetical protein